MSIPEQLDLFAADPDEHLFPYWRGCLKQWILDAWTYRHKRYATGWSMARQGMMFSRLLLMHGQMSKVEFRRWVRFKRRIRRWDKREESK